MNSEQHIKTLELICIMQKIEIEVFKARQATRRWGTPEGNPVAVIHLKRAEDIMHAYKWPEDIKEKAAELLGNIAKYKNTLEEYDVTYGSMYKTYLDDSFHGLEEILYKRLY